MQIQKSIMKVKRYLLQMIIKSIGLLLISVPYLTSAQNLAIAQTSPSQLLKEKLKQYQGQVVYIDFWASWCKPCRQSFPWMNKMKSQYQTQGLRIVTINLDKESELAAEFLELNPAEFEIIYDAKGEIASQFELKGMPMSFVFDRSGEVKAAHVGFNSKKQLEYEAKIIELLKQEVVKND